jgi:hypothetical protein
MPFDPQYNTNPLLAEYTSKYELVVDSLSFMRKIPMIPTQYDTIKIAKQDLAEIRRVAFGTKAFGADIETTGLSKEYFNFNLESYSDSKGLSGIAFNTMNAEGFAISQQLLAVRVATAIATNMLKDLQTTIFTAASYSVTNATMNIANPSIDNGVLDSIINAKKSVHLACGKKPNTIILTGDVFYQMLKQDELKGLYAGGNTGIQGEIDEQWIAKATGLPNVILLDGATNTAGKNATASNAFLSNGFLLVCYLEPTVSLGGDEPSFLAGAYNTIPTALGVNGNIKTMAGIAPFPIRIADNFDAFKTGHGEYKVAGEAIADFKILYPELGYLFTVTTV